MSKTVSSSSFSKITSRVGAAGAAIPAGITGIFRRFWEFTKKNSQGFSKQLKDPEQREEEFVKAVQKDSQNWS